jgi:hypothetical protein
VLNYWRAKQVTDKKEEYKDELFALDGVMLSEAATNSIFMTTEEELYGQHAATSRRQFLLV